MKILDRTNRSQVESNMDFKELGKSGLKIPVLGLGTWGIGGGGSRSIKGDDESLRALVLGLELKMCLIDTAEIYGSGHSEEIVAKAVKSQRGNVFIATKVSPEHLHYNDLIKSCESSLKRLETKYVDLYQIHWPNPSVLIAETMKAMEYLVAEGKIHHIGVSNFSVEQTREAQDALSKSSLASNQVRYSLLDRSIETDLLAYAEERAYYNNRLHSYCQGTDRTRWARRTLAGTGRNCLQVWKNQNPSGTELAACKGTCNRNSKSSIYQPRQRECGCRWMADEQRGS